MSPSTKSKEQKALSFTGEIDDVFTILMKQKSGEYILIHNNITDCKCLFCKKFIKFIMEVSK